MDHVDGLLRIARDLELRGELGSPLGAFCHQFRNRLNSLKLGIYLAKRQAAGELAQSWETLERDYLAIEDRLDRIQLVCRVAHAIPVGIGLDLLFEDRSPSWTEALQRGGAHLTLTPPTSGCPTRVDIERIGSALDDLVLWRSAARSGHREVRVEWDHTADRTTIRWSESLLASEPVAADRAEPWRTWTLPILARLMADHRGTLTVSEGPTWELTLQWPA